ncbi:Putative flavin monooxygenase, FAD/NAD(P)-binding domain superfamily [Septoria linicola]|uniref:Flavin monooxygenase, FAD/NAD(P)-binding domain superfamily n=1 Tax=Septoria linicola TaxID=215465 RepID=A0A9Q9B353_9PEZI|nr:putative flavin monooxygenase, FAD/NAD(P)-binding domain superfamily [Septoria linicola]USW56376.1 Putative flavin monooxygenase, FAD/NAD(P)-binding domain superfamily [Septoria linicola]
MGSMETPALAKDDIANSKSTISTVVELVDDSQSPPETFEAENAWTYPWPTEFRLDERPIDEVRKLKVAVIGSGLAGITAGVLLPAKVPGIDLTIIEKNGDVGGTWYENIYPGVRCDIPAHVYQSTFSPKTQWTEEYAQGKEILAYWQSVARKHKVYDYIRFNTKVTGAYWIPQQAQWSVKTLNMVDGSSASEHYDFVITAIGHFNEWKLPSYPGIETYKGHLRHSSNWDPDFDPKGKRIATIGNGASGIQVTTELQKLAGQVDHYARNRTWIAGSFNPAVKDRQNTPMYFTDEQLESFKNPAQYLEYRKQLEDNFFRGFDSQLIDSDTTKDLRQNFIEAMRKRVVGKPGLLENLVPDFPPNCRRLTPGPGYLEALCASNLTFVQTPIERFVEDGIVTTDGVHRPADAVICSTGANVDYAPPFPIVSGNLDLSRDWRADGAFGWPRSYLGMMTDGFPNLAYLLGPNPAGPSGTVPHTVENQVTYIAKILRKISSQHIKSIVPSKAATDDFVAYADAFFPRTNMSLKCSSWSNGGRPGARIHGHWPGSGAHVTHARREVRWEDFEYTRSSANRFAYFGNGQTAKEKDPASEMTPYLKLPEANDLRDLHERWWDL